MSAPYAKEPVTLQLVGKAVSQPFIEMTTLLMEQFGIHTKHDKEKNAYIIPQGAFINPPEVAIEADASSATYPLAMAALTGGAVTVLNVGQHSLQVRIENELSAIVVISLIGWLVGRRQVLQSLGVDGMPSKTRR